MYKKVSIKIIVILVTAAILTVPSSMLQISHAQSNANLKTALDMHNQARAAVGVQPLTWSSSLATQAQGYADQLKSQGYVCNGSNGNLDVCRTAEPYKYLPHGASNENLAWGSVGWPVSSMVQSWIDEKSYMGQHYTAMVWQNTRQVGCGTANGAQIDILVCRYDPPGNIAGQVPFGPGAAAPPSQAVGEEESTLAPPPQEGVGGGDGGDTSGGGDGGDTSGGGDGGDTSGGGDGGDTSGGGDGDAN
jgi:pathogenesis-related protein 1